MVGSAALRNIAFSLAQACSIGLKSRLQGGRQGRLTPPAPIEARLPGRSWLPTLPVTTRHATSCSQAPERTVVRSTQGWSRGGPREPPAGSQTWLVHCTGTRS